MTLPELKIYLRNETINQELCDTIHEAMTATTMEEMIQLGLPIGIWLYQTGIVNDTLLANFDQSLLHAAGVYASGTHSITNPDKEIFIGGTSIVTVNQTGANKVKINALGNSNLIVNSSGQCYAKVKLHDKATAAIIQEDDSIVDFETHETSVATIILKNNSLLQLRGKGNGEVTLTANGNAICNAKMYFTSKLTYTANGDSVVNTEAFDGSKIINTLT